MQKISCYVDESGQDPTSQFFVTAVILVERFLEESFRQHLITLESATKVGARKWHKSQHNLRIDFLSATLNQYRHDYRVYTASYQKPLLYFLPLLETIEGAIRLEMKNLPYRATITIDGIDRKKSSELTGALRLKGVALDLIRSKRDESEPLIRLADRWAGCLRGALLERKEEKNPSGKGLSSGLSCALNKKIPSKKGISVSLAIPDKSGPISANRAGLRQRSLMKEYSRSKRLSIA